MCITINDIIAEKMIDLSYPISSCKEAPTKARRTPQAEVAVVIMLSDNVQYWLEGPMKILLKTGKETMLTKGVYMDKELNAILRPELKSQMVSSDDVLKTNKSENVTEMAINVEELNNSDNLEDGRPSNTLFTYYVTGPEYSTRFEPHTPQYKKLKYDTITSLTLRIMDQTGNIITLVLHIK